MSLGEVTGRESGRPLTRGDSDVEEEDPRGFLAEDDREVGARVMSQASLASSTPNTHPLKQSIMSYLSFPFISY